jgi:hypothetical protein
MVVSHDEVMNAIHITSKGINKRYPYHSKRNGIF